MKRIVITGPTGTIGMAIINKMVSNGVEVLAICNPKSKRNSYISTNPLVTLIYCDLAKLKNMDCSLLPKYDVFYHLGWAGTFGDGRNDMHLQNDNITYALDAVDLAYKLGCQTFIGAGSQAEYGRAEGVLSPATPANPENGYGMAKLCTGAMTRVECEVRGLKHIWFRVLSIYGPYDGKDTMVMSTIYQLINGKIPQTTQGIQQWDYLYSEDAGEAFYLAGLKGKHAAIYCLGSGNTKPLHEYICQIRDIVNPKSRIDFGAIEYSPKQVMYLCADISTLHADTGFTQRTDFKCGIEKTVSWCKKQIIMEKNYEDN